MVLLMPMTICYNVKLEMGQEMQRDNDWRHIWQIIHKHAFISSQNVRSTYSRSWCKCLPLLPRRSLLHMPRRSLSQMPRRCKSNRAHWSSLKISTMLQVSGQKQPSLCRMCSCKLEQQWGEGRTPVSEDSHVEFLAQENSSPDRHRRQPALQSNLHLHGEPW